jgi:hypothetical protein
MNVSAVGLGSKKESNPKGTTFEGGWMPRDLKVQKDGAHDLFAFVESLI